MFKIKDNYFLTKRRVNYKDEKGNTIVIFADKEGKTFSVKIRLNDSNFSIDNLIFEFPYEIDGVTFRVKQYVNNNYDYIHNEEIPEEIRNILMDSLEIIQRWIDIQYIMYQISQFPTLMKMIDKNQFDSGMSFMNIIKQGESYEELKDIMKIYEKMCIEEVKK